MSNNFITNNGDKDSLKKRLETLISASKELKYSAIKIKYIPLPFT